MELSTQKILAYNDGPVGRIILNNPERRNAISLDMWQGISEAFDHFSGNPKIRCIVMSGAGDKAFASGADISQFKERGRTQTPLKNMPEFLWQADKKCCNVKNLL